MIAEEVAAHSEVQNLYLMSGAYDLAVIVRGKSLREVSRFVSEKISTYDSVISTATHFILKKYKVEGAVMQKPSGGDRLRARISFFNFSIISLRVFEYFKLFLSKCQIVCQPAGNLI